MLIVFFFNGTLYVIYEITNQDDVAEDVQHVDERVHQEPGVEDGVSEVFIEKWDYVRANTDHRHNHEHNPHHYHHDFRKELSRVVPAQPGRALICFSGCVHVEYVDTGSELYPLHPVLFEVESLFDLILCKVTEICPSDESADQDRSDCLVEYVEHELSLTRCDEVHLIVETAAKWDFYLCSAALPRTEVDDIWPNDGDHDQELNKYPELELRLILWLSTEQRDRQWRFSVNRCEQDQIQSLKWD